MTKIAICFYGITRSLKYTINSIETNFFNVFKKNNIDYDIFLHTYKLDKYINNRTKEKDNNPDNELYKMLHPNYFLIDDDKIIRENIDLKKYRTKKDPWVMDGSKKYNSVDNFILSCYSKYQVSELVYKTKNKYDYVLFTRPDCCYPYPFEIKYFNSICDNTICIPNFHLAGYVNNINLKFNDRFSICNNKNYRILAELYLHLYKISLKEKLHSETVISNYLTKNNIKWNLIDFIFYRVRLSGKICKYDKNLVPKL